MREAISIGASVDSAEEVAQTIAEYNLLALPVIDDEGDIAGIVTVDDAMEILLPKNIQQSSAASFRRFERKKRNGFDFSFSAVSGRKRL
jgi:Mg/Co/Ni transporter MgtE